MVALRYVLPTALAVAGVAFLVAGGETLRYEMFAMLAGAAISVLLFNLLFRMGASGDRERAAEDEAREFLRVHGHWPDEPPPVP